MANARPSPKAAAQAGKQPVWALAVVSSEGQADTLQHQRRWAEETCDANAWRLTRVVEGVSSGKAGPRRLVRDLLADLRTMEPEARPKRLLMIRADRLGRGSIIESLGVLSDLKELGVSVFTREGGEEKLDTGADELMAAAKLSIARIENDVRSDKRREVIRQKKAAGIPFGRVPFGLTRRNGKDVADPPRAAVVREAFKLRVAGAGLQAIGKRLSLIAPPHKFLNRTEKHPTGERIVHWTATRVSILLSNRAYVGTIVTEAVFARAQKIAGLLTNAPRHYDAPRKYQWPLTGALHCHCGASMSGLPCGKHPWRYRYYACKQRWHHDGKLRLIRAERLEEQFTEILKRLRASPDLVERYRRRAAAPVSPKLLDKTIRELRAKLAEVEHKRDRVWEIQAAGAIRATDCQERLDRLATQRDELTERLATAQEQLSIAKSSSNRDRDVEALFRRAPTIFALANDTEKRSIARAVAIELGGLKVNKKGELQIGQ